MATGAWARPPASSTAPSRAGPRRGLGQSGHEDRARAVAGVCGHLRGRSRRAGAPRLRRRGRAGRRLCRNRRSVGLSLARAHACLAPARSNGGRRVALPRRRQHGGRSGRPAEAGSARPTAPRLVLGAALTDLPGGGPGRRAVRSRQQGQARRRWAWFAGLACGGEGVRLRARDALLPDGLGRLGPFLGGARGAEPAGRRPFRRARPRARALVRTVRGEGGPGASRSRLGREGVRGPQAVANRPSVTSGRTPTRCSRKIR